MSLFVSGEGELLYPQRYKDLPSANWKLLWDGTEGKPILDHRNYPVFGVEEQPELGLFIIDPFQDTATRIVGH